MISKKRAQVWIETVLYTLIGIALIGLVLGFVMPKVNEYKDNMVVEQSISSLQDFDEKINAVIQAPGNIRPIDLTMKRGKFIIRPDEDTLSFIISDLKKPYSQPGVQISIGRVKALSTKEQKYSTITLILNYSTYLDLTQNDKKELKEYTPAPTAYKFLIESKDPAGSALQIVNIKEAG